jgi:adenosylmethionine-8-amino-7-oxononanoate aminotransferase
MKDAIKRHSETMTPYLQTSELIDWQHPDILKLAKQMGALITPIAIAQHCFKWVRDQIHHSVDYQMNPITCRAS